MFLIKQKKSLHGGLAAVSVILLGGCVGGSFDLLELDLNPPPSTASKKPPRKAVRRNAEEQDKLLQPASGFAMRSVRRNSAKFDKNGNAIPNNGEAEQRLALDGGGLMAIEGVELSEIEGGFRKSNSSFSRVNANENNCHVLCKELKNHPDEKGSDGRTSNISNSGNQQKDNYTYIRFGYVSSDSSNAETKLSGSNKTVERQGNHFYTYYYGVNPSASLPMGTVKYSGEWFFMTDAVKNRKGVTCTTQGQECIRSIFPVNTGFSGDYSSASRFGNTGASNNKYNADFSVDFSTKKLTGNLNYSSNTTADSTVYKLEADIKGNRFIGKAKYQDNDNAAEFVKNSLNADSSYLEGGFYGPRAQELAGKFLSDDNSAFVVFGGKQSEDGGKSNKSADTDDSGQQTAADNNTTALFDAFYITKPVIEKVEYEEEYTEDEDEESEDSEGEVSGSDDEQDEQQNEEDDVGVSSDDEADTEVEELQSMAVRIARSADDVDDTDDDEEGEENEEEEGIDDENTVVQDSVTDTEASDSSDIADNTDNADMGEEEFEDEFEDEEYEEVLVDAVSKINVAQSANFGDIMKFRSSGYVFDLSGGSKLSPDLKQDFPDAVVITDEDNQQQTIVLTKKENNTTDQYVDVCCFDFNHLRFGSYRLKNKHRPNSEAVSGLYVQGESTRAEQMPQTGNAKYEGKWEGFIWGGKPKNESKKTKGSTPQLELREVNIGNKEGKAEFNVDFSNKKITGNLNRGSIQMFDIEATLQGSRFSGTAKTHNGGEINLDTQEGGRGSVQTGSVIKPYKIKVEGAEVKGGFYGDSAAEMGGYVFHNGEDDGVKKETVKIGIVFGAKKQAVQSQRK